MATISVVLATYNEENNLPECLNSVKSLADEIIIVDGTSTDKTVDIAKKYNARVKITDNPPIFHINKQKAIDMATQDWILQLDADERVTPLLCDEIKNKISDIKNDDVDGYWIPRKNWFLGRFLMKGGQYPDYTLRLYKKGKGRLPQKDVHEQAIIEGKVGYLKNPLVHYSFKNFSDYLDRFNKYTNLISEELKETKASLNLFTVINYFFVKTIYEFFLIYIRNKGFKDGFPGFIFAFFSSLRFAVGYVKYIEKYHYAKIN